MLTQRHSADGRWVWAYDTESVIQCLHRVWEGPQKGDSLWDIKVCLAQSHPHPCDIWSRGELRGANQSHFTVNGKQWLHTHYCLHIGLRTQWLDAGTRVAIYAGSGAKDHRNWNVRMQVSYPLKHWPFRPPIRNCHVFESGLTTVEREAHCMTLGVSPHYNPISWNTHTRPPSI